MSSNEETAFQHALPVDRPVPRISVHAFCVHQETSDALQEVSNDRRLSKARIGIQMGGIHAAVSYYAEQMTPNLLIVETMQSGDGALSELDALAEVCDPLTKVIVIGHTNDINFYRDLLHRGASEYLITPVAPLRLIEVIADLYASPDTQPVGRMIAFVGARGGAGASTMAHNIAWTVSEEFHIGTTLIDFDLPFGTVALDYNEDTGQGILDALEAPERIDDVLLERLVVRHGEFLSILTAPAILERGLDFEPDAYSAVIDVARRAMPCIIADVPNAWTAQTQTILSAADDIVIVATPDLTALRNAKNLVEYLRNTRANDPPPKLLLNQLNMPRRPQILEKDFIETIGYAPFASVGFDAAAFGLAANNGQPLAHIGNAAAAQADVRKAAAILVGREDAAAAPVKKEDFLASIFRKFKQS